MFALEERIFSCASHQNNHNKAIIQETVPNKLGACKTEPMREKFSRCLQSEAC